MPPLYLSMPNNLGSARLTSHFHGTMENTTLTKKAKYLKVVFVISSDLVLASNWTTSRIQACYNRSILIDYNRSILLINCARRYYSLAVQAGFYGDAVECLTATREIRVRSPSGSGPKIFFFTCHIPLTNTAIIGKVNLIMCNMRVNAL